MAECLDHPCVLASTVFLPIMRHMCSLGAVTELNAVTILFKTLIYIFLVLVVLTVKNIRILFSHSFTLPLSVFLFSSSRHWHPDTAYIQ